MCNCLLSCRYDLINWRAGFCTPHALNLQGVNYGKSVRRKPLIDRRQLGQRNFVHSARVSLEKARHIRWENGGKDVYSWSNITFSNSVKILGSKLTGRQLFLLVVSSFRGKGWHYSLHRVFAWLCLSNLCYLGCFWLSLFNQCDFKRGNALFINPLKLNTPVQSLFYVEEARVNHCCSLFKHNWTRQNQAYY